MKYVASYHQEKVLFIDEFERGTLYEGGPVYHNIPLILFSKSELDVSCIKKAFQKLCYTHEVLRTRILDEEGIIYQAISDDTNGEVEVINLQDLKECKEIEDKILKIAEKAFSDGLQNSLVKGYYFISGNGYYYMMVFHYLVCDNASTKIFRDNFVCFYGNYLNGIEKNDAEELENDRIQYLDFSDWQRQLPKEVIDSQLLYWKMKAGKFLQPLELPIDKKRELVHIFKSAETERILPVGIAKKLKAFANAHSVEEKFLFLTAFKIVLSKFSGLREINVGSWMDIREEQELTGVAGPIENIVLLKDVIEADESFMQVMGKVIETYQEAKENSLIPFDKLVTELKTEIDMSRTALFDVMFNYEEDDFTDDIFSMIDMNRGFGKFDYHLKITLQGDKDILRLVYNSLYYNKETADNLIDTFIRGIEHFIDSPDKKIGKISILSEQDKERMINVWNISDCNKVDTNIVQLFKAQCLSHGNKTAVKDGDAAYSYHDVDLASDKFAVYLKKKGIKQEEFVAIYMEKSISCIIAILGVLKAGAAYLPIDPSIPKERQKFILSDSEARYVVIDEDKENEISGTESIFVNDSAAIEEEEIKILDEIDISSSNSAYIIYTSGTTGEPKGMIIEHSNLTSLIENNKEILGLKESDVWTMFHSYGFDFSVWELFGSLLTGGTLVLVSENVSRDTVEFYKLLKHEKVTILNQTPLAFYALDAEDDRYSGEKLSLRKVIFGGEKLDFDRIKNWKKKYNDVELINMYGITETTIHVTFKKIEQNDIDNGISNIGKPLNGYTIYLVDQFLNLLPVGVQGEIMVGGTGLGRGYWNRKVLTEERFISNPYGKGRLYHSGDLARRLHNGDLEYLGRIDEQVKIRGYRIETGEISNRIKLIDGIHDCVVIAKKDQTNDTTLYAYFTSEQEINISNLKEEIRNYLPDYMIPPYMMQLDSIPVTKNGKLDKAMLPEISLNYEKGYVEPINEKQEMLCKLFAEITGVEKVGITNSFFELGGDSIKAIRVASKLREWGYSCSVKDVMTFKTVKALSEIISSDNSTKLSNETVIGEVTLTPIMKEFFELNHGQLEQLIWSNVLSAGSIDEKVLRASLDKICMHHDMLRAVCRNGKIVIKKEDAGESYHYSSHIVDSGNEGDINAKIKAVYDDVIKSFDMSDFDKPLFHVALVKASGTDYLIIAVHHLLMDQVSWLILMEDLENLYGALSAGKAVTLPDKTTSFKRWSEKLLEYANSLRIQAQKEYWKNIDDIFTKNDIKDVGEDGCEYNLYRHSLQKDNINRLSELIKSKLNTNLSTVFLTVVLRGLRKKMKVDKFSVMVEKHGREDIDPEIITDRTIGWFTCKMPVILYVSDDIMKDIINTKETLSSIPDEGLGYGLLKYSNQLNPGYCHSDILYNYFGETHQYQRDSMWEITDIQLDNALSDSYDKGSYLSVNILINKGKTSFDIEYDTRIYEQEDIQQLCAYVENELSVLGDICLHDEGTVLSASDFGLQGMDVDDFDNLLNEILADEE